MATTSGERCAICAICGGPFTHWQPASASDERRWAADEALAQARGGACGSCAHALGFGHFEVEPGTDLDTLRDVLTRGGFGDLSGYRALKHVPYARRHTRVAARLRSAKKRTDKARADEARRAAALAWLDARRPERAEVQP